MSAPVVLATAEQVMARTGATRASAEAVLAALAPAIRYAASGAADDALAVLNKPLMDYEPVQDLLAWFVPTLVSDALVRLGGGDAHLLPIALDAMGLLQVTGEVYARVQAALSETGQG